MEIPVSAKAALLQVLLEGPGYGSELMKRVQDRTNGAVNLLQGSLYPALEKLTKSGDVKECGQYYTLTLQGEKLAESQREALKGLITEPRKGRQRNRSQAIPT